MNTIRQRIRRTPIVLVGVVAASLIFLSACADNPGSKAQESSSTPAPLEISGTYVDQYSTTQNVSSTTWSDSFGDVFHILSYSNAQDFLIAQNDAGNAFNANLYSRFDWTIFNSDLYYCQTDYDAPDVTTATAASADRTNPVAAGCDATANFPWTNLTPPAGP